MSQLPAANRSVASSDGTIQRSSTDIDSFRVFIPFRIATDTPPSNQAGRRHFSTPHGNTIETRMSHCRGRPVTPTRGRAGASLDPGAPAPPDLRPRFPGAAPGSPGTNKLPPRSRAHEPTPRPTPQLPSVLFSYVSLTIQTACQRRARLARVAVSLVMRGDRGLT